MGRAFEVRKVKMAKTNAAKAKVNGKYGKEVYMAAKSNPDPDTNDTLKRIIARALKDECSRDTIDRAIKKAKDGTGEDYKVVVYEGFVTGDATIIIECNTDNLNRTAGEVRSAFTKSDTKIGVQGSVMHGYEYLAVVAVEALTEDQIFESMLNHNVDISEVEVQDGVGVIYGPISTLNGIEDALKADFPTANIVMASIKYIPNEEVTLDAEGKEKYEDLIERLEKIEDVQEIYTNIKE